MFDLLSGTSTQVGQHEGPIKCVKWFEMPQGGILATGSWDKTLKVQVHPFSHSIQSALFFPSTWSLTLRNTPPRTKYWDLRSPTPLATVELKERCYAMDVKNKVLVVGTAGRHIQIFDLANPITPYKVGAYSPPDRVPP